MNSYDIYETKTNESDINPHNEDSSQKDLLLLNFLSEYNLQDIPIPHIPSVQPQHDQWIQFYNDFVSFQSDANLNPLEINALYNQFQTLSFMDTSITSHWQKSPIMHDESVRVSQVIPITDYESFEPENYGQEEPTQLSQQVQNISYDEGLHRSETSSLVNSEGSTKKWPMKYYTRAENRVSKACEGCNKAKRKCSMNRPCSRCVRNGLPCVHRDMGDRRGRH